jgi:hypothetical protein
MVSQDTAGNNRLRSVPFFSSPRQLWVESGPSAGKIGACAEGQEETKSADEPAEICDKPTEITSDGECHAQDKGVGARCS